MEANETLPIRHGDVVLWPVKGAPWPDIDKLGEVERKPGAPLVLTEGSATGHEHVLEGGAVRVFDAGEMGRVLVLAEPGRLVHAGHAPRHAPIELAAGVYRQSIKRQAVGEDGWANVED